MATPGDLAAILHKGDNFQFAFMDTNLLLKMGLLYKKEFEKEDFDSCYLEECIDSLNSLIFFEY